MVTAPAGAKPVSYVRAVRRRWHLVAACFVLGLAAGYLTSKPAAPSHGILGPGSAKTASAFQATAILMPIGVTGGADPSGLSVDGMAYFATTGAVPRMVAQQLGYKGDPNVLAAEVQVTTNDKIGALQISASSSNGADAVKLVDAFSQQLINYLDQQIHANRAKELAGESSQMQAMQQQIGSLQAQKSTPVVQAQLAAAQSQYNTLLGQYEQLSAAPQQTTLTVIQPPVATPSFGVPPAASSTASGGTGGSSSSPTTVATTSSSSSHSTIPQGRKTRTLLGGVVGLLVGLALALLLDRNDTRVYDRDQAEEVYGLPVLAEIHGAGEDEVPVRDEPMSAAAEGYRLLQASLAAAMGKDGEPREVILVAPACGDHPGGAVAANLALCFHDDGTQATVISSSDDSGLPELLAGEVSLLEPERRYGSPGAHTARIREMIDSTRRHPGVVVVDTAPVLTAHEAAQLAPHTDAVVLVAAAGRDKAGDARRAVSMLRHVGAPLAGIVLMQPARSWLPFGAVTRSLRPSRSGSRSARRSPAHRVSTARSESVVAPTEEVDEFPSYASNE